jgi:hypothetical protein
MFTILIFLKAITVAWVCAESQTFKFFGFFKQRNILNKSYFNTEVVENCLIAKEKKSYLSFLFCGQYREWKCLTAVDLKDSSLLWQHPRYLVAVSRGELQHHLGCPGSRSLCLEAAGCLWKSCVVWHFCEAERPASEDERTMAA